MAHHFCEWPIKFHFARTYDQSMGLIHNAKLFKFPVLSLPHVRKLGACINRAAKIVGGVDLFDVLS